MKTALIAIMALLTLNISANASSGNLDSQFSGNYGGFTVSYDQVTGRIKLADSKVRKIYAANVRTGQELPLDIEFLQFSRSPFIQQYADYLLSATVSAQLDSNGSINFVIKAKVNFDGGTEPQVILVFGATSRPAKRTYIDYAGYSHEVKTIESDLRFQNLEYPQGTQGSSSVYQLLLTFIFNLWPSEGFHSTIAQNWW